jgi:flagellar motor switch protein FliM
MKRPILSREEVAALMEGMGAEPAPAPNPSSTAVQAPGTVPDPTRDAGKTLTAPGEASVRTSLQALDALHRSFAFAFSAALSKLAQRDVQVVAQPAREWTFQDWVDSVRRPMLVNVVRIQRVAGPGLVAFEAPWLRSLVDLMFGGTGSGGGFGQRPGSSSVERAVCARLAQQACRAYAYACAAKPALRMTWQRCEDKLGASGFHGPHEVVAAASFVLTHGLATANAWVVLPMAAVELMTGPVDVRSAGSSGHRSRA